MTTEREALADAREALDGLLRVIDAAGLQNLTNGVQLGPTVWYVKASDAMNYARAALAKIDAAQPQQRSRSPAIARLVMSRRRAAMCHLCCSTRTTESRGTRETFNWTRRAS
jgi:hypothetical protein